MKFVFKNLTTGETVSGCGFALNPVARSLGLPVVERKLAAPWSPLSLWDGETCLWHYDETGTCIAGPPKKP